MSELLVVPFKKPSEVDMVKPLQNLIISAYASSSSAPVDYSDAVSEFNKLRNSAIWKVFEKYESSLEVIYGYGKSTKNDQFICNVLIWITCNLCSVCVFVRLFICIVLVVVVVCVDRIPHTINQNNKMITTSYIYCATPKRYESWETISAAAPVWWARTTCSQ